MSAKFSDKWYEQYQSKLASFELCGSAGAIKQVAIAKGTNGKIKMPAIASKLESELEMQLKLAGITGWVREFRFHPTRRWRADFAFPDRMLLIECDGGVWSNGRHNRGKGFIEDQAKHNQAQLLGYTVLRFTMETIKSGKALDDIMRFIYR